MVQINLFLLYTVATITPSLAHRFARREDTDIGSAFSRRFYDGDSIVFAREDALDLEQREPLFNWLLHPQQSWREHRRVHAAAKAAKLDEKAKIAAEHNEALNPPAPGGLSERDFDDFDFDAREDAFDLEQREPLLKWIRHPQESWREHRRVHAASRAGKLNEKAKIAEEHNEALNPPAPGGLSERDFDDFDFDAREDAFDLEQREPFMNWLLHPQKSWREHRRVHAAAKAAKLDEKAKIAAEHNEALNPPTSGGLSERGLSERVSGLKSVVEQSDSDFDKEKLQERLAKLAGGVAVVKVGAPTEVERKEKKARVEDALRAKHALHEALGGHK
jgi:hypothetical protein